MPKPLGAILKVFRTVLIAVMALVMFALGSSIFYVTRKKMLIKRIHLMERLEEGEISKEQYEDLLAKINFWETYWDRSVGFVD